MTAPQQSGSGGYRAENSVLDTSTGRAHGQDECPQCGSTDVVHKPGTSRLGCRFCRHVWEGVRLEERLGLGVGIEALRGRVVSTGASDITSDDSMVTMKCQGCGSEVSVDTAHSTEAKCHWCRSILSLNDKVANGAIPDGILPFSVTKDDAVEKIKEFTGKRSFFAHPEFKKNFVPENVRGVFLPYLVVDGTYRALFHGVAESQTRRYTKGSGNSKSTYYDANAFNIARQFDVHVDDLLVESSSRRSQLDNDSETNNIINSILPFDVKNAVAFDSNYMSGFTGEKRDMDIDDAVRRAHEMFLTVARQRMSEETSRYDRGVAFSSEQAWVRGSRWTTVYLPVWLYSHMERKSDGTRTLHYIAVNGRNGETMGSVPINMTKTRLFGLLWGTVVAAPGAAIAAAIFFANMGQA